MGSWGFKTFENDGAMDFLGHHLDYLTNIIEGNLTPEKVVYPDYLDRIGEPVVMPALELVVLLCTSYNTLPDVEVEAIERWRSVYLNVYDRKHASTTKNTIDPRREIIVDNFDKLIAIAE